MSSLFDMDNKFFTFMSKVADLVILNVIFLLSCIPIFTIGTSITALSYVTKKMVKNEESYIIRSYFKAFKENFKQSTIIWLLALAVGIILYLDFYVMNQMTGTLSTIMKFALLVFLLLFLMILTYVFPLQATFFNTIRHTITNALLMAIRHLPYTILILIITLGPILITFFSGNATIFSYGLLAWILIGFSLTGFATSYFFNKVFQNYMPDETEADSEATEDPAVEDSNLTK